MVEGILVGEFRNSSSKNFRFATTTRAPPKKYKVTLNCIYITAVRSLFGILLVSSPSVNVMFNFDIRSPENDALSPFTAARRNGKRGSKHQHPRVSSKQGLGCLP